MKAFALGSISMLVALGTAGGAFAQDKNTAPECVTSADLIGGIRLGYADGSSEVMTRLNPHVITSDLRFADSKEGVKLLIAKGIYVLSISDIDAEGQVITPPNRTVQYPVGLENLEVLAPGAAVKIVSIVNDRDLGVVEEELVVRAAPHDDLVMGNCTYQAQEIAITYPETDEMAQTDETLVYMPELEFAFLWKFKDGAELEEVYTLVNISRN